MYSYKPLENKLKEVGLTKSALAAKLGISSRTIAKISKGEKIANNVLVRIASHLANFARGKGNEDLRRALS